MYQSVTNMLNLAVAPETSSAQARRVAREILQLCTTTSVSAGGKVRLSQILASTVDWKYLISLAEFHGITPLISYNLNSNGISRKIPQPYLYKLNQIYNNTLFKNVILSTELAKVLSVFSQHGIPVIPLKGTVLAELLYGNPGLRTMVDIDILVKPEELPRASSLLVEMGYKQLSEEPAQTHPFHGAPYRKEGKFPFFLELHWDLDDAKLVSIPRQAIWRRVKTLKLPWGSTLVLSPEDNLLYMSIQLSKQVTQVKVLCDIAALLNKYDGVLDWGYIIESAHSWQIETVVYYSLKRAQDVLGAPVPASLAELKPGAWQWRVIDFLVNEEVFALPIKDQKLRNETSVLVRSLMMKHFDRTLMVLSDHRGPRTRAAWLRTAIWMMLVFGAALGRNAARIASGWNWSVRTSKNEVVKEVG
jgi:hypothetical protein